MSAALRPPVPTTIQENGHGQLAALPTIHIDQLDDVTGGFDVNRMVDNGNRYAAAGGALGGAAGGTAGALAGAGVLARPAPQ